MAISYRSFNQSSKRSGFIPLILLVCLLLIGAICTFIYSSSVIESSTSALQLQEFHNYVLKYHKFYESNLEYQSRYEIFTQNLQLINEHNSQDLPWKLAVNQFADLSRQEFSDMLNSKSFISEETIGQESDQDLVIPESKDWVTEGIVAPSVDAGKCGMAGIHVGVAAIQCAHALETGEVLILSRQQVIDCGSYSPIGQCTDTTAEGVYEYAVKFGGLEKSTDYPGKGVVQECKEDASKIAARISSYVHVEKNSEYSLKVALASRPLSVVVDATSWQFYSSGILSDNCGQSLNHAVLLVGYGQDSDESFWRLQNSWGLYWGERGYIRMLRNDSSTDGGLCGIAMSGSYPVV